jgi:hypothetical protein
VHVALAVGWSGDCPGEKLEVLGSRVSGVRSPFVSTTTVPLLFTASAVRLQGRGVAGKLKFAVSSSFRAPLFRAGFIGMNVIRALTAIGATNSPPPSCVRRISIVVTRCCLLPREI